MSNLKNTTKLKDTGSIMNFLMGNNNSAPEVDKGATICLYSDRHAYQVMAVSIDGKHIIMQRCNSKRTDKLGMSEDQDYDYSELSGRNEEFVYRQGAWRKVIKSIVFEDRFAAYLDGAEKAERDELLAEVRTDEPGEFLVVPGKTRTKTTYHKVNVIFGVQREFYDFTR